MSLAMRCSIAQGPRCEAGDGMRVVIICERCSSGSASNRHVHFTADSYSFCDKVEVLQNVFG